MVVGTIVFVVVSQLTVAEDVELRIKLMDAYSNCSNIVSKSTEVDLKAKAQFKEQAQALASTVSESVAAKGNVDVKAKIGKIVAPFPEALRENTRGCLTIATTSLAPALAKATQITGMKQVSPAAAGSSQARPRATSPMPPVSGSAVVVLVGSGTVAQFLSAKLPDLFPLDDSSSFVPRPILLEAGTRAGMQIIREDNDRGGLPSKTPLLAMVVSEGAPRALMNEFSIRPGFFVTLAENQPYRIFVKGTPNSARKFIEQFSLSKVGNSYCAKLTDLPKLFATEGDFPDRRILYVPGESSGTKRDLEEQAKRAGLDFKFPIPGKHDRVDVIDFSLYPASFKIEQFSVAIAIGPPNDGQKSELSVFVGDNECHQLVRNYSLVGRLGGCANGARCRVKGCDLLKEMAKRLQLDELAKDLVGTPDCEFDREHTFQAIERTD